jgi:hypothetical protein
MIVDTLAIPAPVSRTAPLSDADPIDRPSLYSIFALTITSNRRIDVKVLRQADSSEANLPTVVVFGTVSGGILRFCAQVALI